MRAFVFKPTAIAVALAFSVSSPLLAQQAPAGASKASSSAVGGVSAGTIGAAVAVVAAAAALSGGSGGASSANANSSTIAAATQASAAAAAAATANQAATAAANTMGVSGVASVVTAAALATQLQGQANAAASNLNFASNTVVSGVVNPITGVKICAAATTCTAAERLLLAYEAARFAKLAAEAALGYIVAVEEAGLTAFKTNAISAAVFATGTAALAVAFSNAVIAQTAANAAITAYNSLASATGVTGTVITTSTGTSGTTGTFSAVPGGF